MFMVPIKMAEMFIKEEELMNTFRNLEMGPALAEYMASFETRVREIPLMDHPNQASWQLDSEIMRELVGNPIHSYTLLRRLVVLVPRVLEEIRGPKKEVIRDLVWRIIGQREFDWVPTDADVEGASQSLARLQFAYRLDPTEIAFGKLREIQTEARLSVMDMMEIAERRGSGRVPMRPQISREYALAIEWAEGALRLSYMLGGSPEEKTYIENFLRQARDHHNGAWVSSEGQKGNLPNEQFFISRIFPGEEGRVLRQREADWVRSQSPTQHLMQGYDIHDFYALCRGETTHSTNISEVDQGRCVFSTNDDPFFLLAPLKVELISEALDLRLLHDLATEGEMLFMKTRIGDKLQGASVQATGGGETVSVERTQSSGWLWDQESPLLLSLARRVSRATGLLTHRPLDQLQPQVPWRFVEAEAWQMGLYGPGGHYLPHYDAFDLERQELIPQDMWQRDLNNLWVGNRIKTVMFYMSDLVGGSTAFPILGRAVTPRRGSAVAWWNLHADGRREDRALHGACPVIKGVKWVSNKWIREGSQIWRRKCNVQPDCQNPYHC